MADLNQKKPKHAPAGYVTAEDSDRLTDAEEAQAEGAPLYSSDTLQATYDESYDELDREEDQDTPKKRSKWILPLIFILVFAVCMGGYFGYNAYHDWRIQEDARLAVEAAKQAAQEAADAAAAAAGKESVTLVDNPIDFTEVRQNNADIYAWIKIPGTKVDYPILQSSVDDNFYLRRNELGEYAQYGCLFTQSKNAQDFSDPVTVVYGHNAANDEYFSTLHYFENDDFFNSYDTIYVYTPGHILTYQVIAAYQYDDRHILNAYDFSVESVRMDYFNSVLNPESMLKQVREGVTLTAGSKLLQLSTCMSTYIVESTRYIVTGVLVNDQPTY